jgi:hypothetical protein
VSVLSGLVAQRPGIPATVPVIQKPTGIAPETRRAVEELVMHEVVNIMGAVHIIVAPKLINE